jgi:hypothetical protein
LPRSCISFNPAASSRDSVPFPNISAFPRVFNASNIPNAIAITFFVAADTCTPRTSSDEYTNSREPFNKFLKRMAFFAFSLAAIRPVIFPQHTSSAWLGPEIYTSD